MKKVFVFLASGFEEIEAISIIDTLRRAKVETIVVTIPQEEDVFWVEGAHGISIAGDSLFDETDFSNGDMLILPGGMPGTNNLNAHEGLKELIEEYNNQNKYVAAICAAPLILGEMGLLKGKKAVCYPGYEDQLIGAEIVENEHVVVDGKIITSKGPGTAIEFALKLVEILVDKNTAEQLAVGMIVG
jgi:4-methyl-5(b-hydroxyethyl)-thiazole monophosphate biosynthesis